jgi:hypothetical protein
MKNKILLIILIISLFVKNNFAQNEKFKALYIYNITKYIDWEVDTEGDYFTIGVLGSSAIVDELKTIAKKRTINEQTVQVVKYSTVDEISECQILYVSSSKSSYITSIISKKGLNSLVITEKTGMTKKGAAINFIDVEGVLKFEVNTANITKYGIDYNSELLNFCVK